MKGLEDLIQKNIVNAVRLYYPHSLIFAVPNGGQRSKATAGILKATGVMAGVSDLIFIHKGMVYFVEVKTDAGKQSESQKDFEKRIHAQGLTYWVVRSAEEILGNIALIDSLDD